MNITEITTEDDYILNVKTEDGKTGFFDVKPFLDSEAFAPLRDEAEFRLIHNGGYFVEWACGADLSADTICARRSRADNENTQREKSSRTRYARR